MLQFLLQYLILIPPVFNTMRKSRIKTQRDLSTAGACYSAKDQRPNYN